MTDIHTCGIASHLLTKQANHKYFAGGNMQNLWFQTFSLQPLFLPSVVVNQNSYVSEKCVD